MPDNQIDITVRVDAQGAVTALDSLGNTLNVVEGRAQSGGNMFDTFAGKIVAFNQGIQLAERALSGITSTADAAFQAIERGSVVADVSEAFDGLSRAAGTTADTLLGQLNKATGETIDNFTLMQKANEALNAGLKPDEFIKLTEAARVLSEQTGQDLKQSIDEVSRAFETGQVRILKNRLGVIDLEAAEKALAGQLGITREELTKEQQVQAARTALMEAATRKTAEFGAVQKDAGDRVQGLTKLLSDSKDKFYQAAASNVELNKALDSLTALLSKVDLKPLVTGLSGIITFGVKAAETIVKNAKAAIELTAALNPAVAALKKAYEIYQLLNPDTSQAEGLMSELGKTTKKAGEAAATAASDFEVMAREMQEYADQSAAAVVQSVKLPPAVKDLGTESNGASSAMASLGRSTETATAALEEFATAQQQLGPGNAEGIAEFGRQMDIIGQKWDSLKSTLGQGLGDVIGSLFNGSQKGIKDSLRGLGGSAGGSVGEALGAQFGPFGAALGGELGSMLGDALGKGIYDGIHHIFSSEDAGTTARKDADKFFADLFDANRLSVIIDGELKRISDLTFGSGDAFGDGSAFDMFNSLPADAQAAFSGVGSAFETFIGNSEDMAGQLAAIFANNLGGSLNNLQLLVQATGLSFDQLKDSVVKAFLDGKLSAAEAQGAIAELQVVMQDGIPGAVGAVTEAFDNLKAAGAKGGRALVDALKDVGFEAKELGLKTLPDVQRYLESTGKFSAEEIQQVMDALSTSGITTIDQLTAATTEQLLPVLAQLENTEFPFAEQFAEGEDALDSMLKKLDSIPDEITKRVHIKVDADVSETAQQFIGNDLGNSNQGAAA